MPMKLKLNSDMRESLWRLRASSFARTKGRSPAAQLNQPPVGELYCFKRVWPGYGGAQAKRELAEPVNMWD